MSMKTPVKIMANQNSASPNNRAAIKLTLTRIPKKLIQ